MLNDIIYISVLLGICLYVKNHSQQPVSYVYPENKEFSTLSNGSDFMRFLFLIKFILKFLSNSLTS